uniref:UDENN domain-containing protein n=1 Tax=Globodera pallida TaxID=36090 RepID=A0A183CRC7_GLOPA
NFYALHVSTPLTGYHQRLPLLPRIHGVSVLTFAQQVVPNMAQYFNILEDGSTRSFYCILALDHLLIPPG